MAESRPESQSELELLAIMNKKSYCHIARTFIVGNLRRLPKESPVVKQKGNNRTMLSFKNVLIENVSLLKQSALKAHCRHL